MATFRPGSMNIGGSVGGRGRGVGLIVQPPSNQGGKLQDGVPPQDFLIIDGEQVNDPTKSENRPVANKEVVGGVDALIDEDEALEEASEFNIAEFDEGYLNAHNEILSKKIIEDQAFTKTYKSLAQLCQDSYKDRFDRKEQLVFGGNTYQYNPIVSNELFSHYETDTAIILSVHGADDVELSQVALDRALKRPAGKELDDIGEFMEAYKFAASSRKDIIVTGHSLGFYLSSEADMKFNKANKNITGCFFGGYAPRRDKVVKHGARLPRFKKILYNNDFLANTILDTKGLKNTLVLEPTNFIETVNTHGIFNFANKSSRYSDDRIVNVYP